MYEILKKIESFGFEAYIVGGYVRDYLLGKNSFDIDICTNARLIDIKKIFPSAKMPIKEFQSVTFKKDNYNYEITTYRQDISYQNNRQPVTYKLVNSLEEDLKRRDFTINTLCFDSNGDLIDLFNAQEDLYKKTIKTVKDPYLSCEEDILRVLRAIRLATTLDFKLDNDLFHAIQEKAYLLKNLSYDRKKEELNKIFQNKNILHGIMLLKSLKLEQNLDLDNLDNLIITTDSLGIWAQLNVIDIYPFSRQDKKDIININKIIEKKLITCETLYYYGLRLCLIAGQILNRKNILELYDQLIIKSPKDININISDYYFKEDKWKKELYSLLEIKILNQELMNNHQEIDVFVKNYLKMKNML